MSYSSNGGGTLTLPSPTHVRNVDVSSAVRQLRRSLSRSPSKFSMRKTSSGGSPGSPLSPSPMTPGGSPSKQLGSPFLGITAHPSSPLATPFPPSVKLSLRSAKHKTPGTHPKRTSPRSPLKRVLSESLDRANTQPQPTRTTNFYGETLPANINSPRRRSFEKRDKSIFSIELPPPVNQALARLESDNTSAFNVSSPLKRTDSTMNLDFTSFGSPVPKRRSMHGSASFGQDFNVFDHASTSTPQFDIHEDTSETAAPAPSPIFSNTAMLFQNANMPKRSSSLRKSTLQQRQEKSSSWHRRQAERERLASGLSNDNGFSTPQKNKDRPRLSLDQFVAPPDRGSPFTTGPLPNPSMHMFNQQPPAFKAHPLSRTLTQSSSSGSIADESPTHVPVHAPARIPVRFDDESRPKIDFSKSLPAGSLRPMAINALKREEFRNNDFSTPENKSYQSAKPHAAAFMSTGLISKVNHHPEAPNSVARHHLRKSVMPDTPCKKPLGGFNTMPAPSTNAMNKVKEFSRHSFGTPSVPLGSAIKPSIVSRNVFGSDFGNKGRRGSFLSIAADNPTSPETFDNLLSDNDMPPTPTKSIFMSQEPGDGSPSATRADSFMIYGSMGKPARPSSKLNILTVTCDLADDAAEYGDLVSPTAVSFRFKKTSASNMSSFGRSRARKGSITPAPLSLGSLRPLVTPTHPGSAKIPTLIADSPKDRIDFAELNTPQTPHVGVNDLSEDASRLTVSGHGRRVLTRQNTFVDSVAKAPPATPTTGRDTILPNGGVTPVHVPKAADIDEHLAARFDRVETVGGGEFSDVFRVTKANVPSFYFSSFGTPSQGSNGPPSTPKPLTFAVKKSRKPYTGPTDRQKKLQEVNVLKALGHTDHIIHLIDSWEMDGYLYIQTEFCEEGSLDTFLANMGRRGRLDDFRIWKIMIEIGEGLQHIHRSGFIHLDLKPANVFITFEGLLKIGDFGMATTHPAPSDIDGEGDREYIGPEILEGKYDTPADIYSFGLIMLEIAGNVQLPDNGPSWQRLRSGDMSDVPSLTFSNASSVSRDALGNPIVDDSDTSMDSFVSDDEMEVELPAGSGRKRNYNPVKRSTSHDPANLFGSMRRGELSAAPAFMTDQYNAGSMDKLVKWMILPEPKHRPDIETVMRQEGVLWVKNRRRAGATIFEGSWGPGDEVLGMDAEMIDV